MDRVHDSIAWYQKQIGSYDKQLWEQSVERKLQRAPANVHHAPRKSVRVKTEFIDVDLIRGSTFSKTKPQAPWTYITRKAIIRVFLLPFCYRWWIQQTSAYFFAMLFLLYCSQVFTLFIYYGNTGEAIVQDELTVSEVFFPIIITFILGLIHSQTVLSHYSHKPPVRDIKLRNISKAKRRAKEPGIPPTVNELVTNSSSVTQETIDNSALTRESNSLRLSSNLSQNGTNTQSRLVNSPEFLLRGDNSQTGCDRDLSQGNEGKSLLGRKSIDSAITKQSATASRSDLENVDTAVPNESCPNRKSNVLFDEKHKGKLSKNLNEINQLQNSSEPSNNDFDLTSLVSKPCLAHVQCCGERCHKVVHHVGTPAYESLCENHESLSDIEQISDEVNLVETDSEDDCPNITHYQETNQMSVIESQINEKCCPSNSKHDDLSRKHNFIISSGQSTQVRKRFTSLQTEDLGEVSDCECMDEEMMEQVEANWRRKRRLSSARSADLGEIARSRVVPSKLTFYSEHSLSRRGVNSSENDPSQSTPEDGNRVAISTEEWEDRIQSDLTTSSSYSTSCDSANELSDGESINQQEIVDLHQGWTSSSLNVINLLQPPTASNIGVSHAPPDKVSCVIWEGNECKKVDLTALDIGWAIIDKVDNLPESSDYIWIGICFSFLIGCVPLAFRAYHTKELPSVLSYSFLIKILETAYPSSWRRNVLMVNGIVQRLCLSLIFFFLLSVADRTFKQRLLYAKHFCYLTSSRRARKFDMPHFRLSKVRNIKTWLSLRSYLKRRGPQRSVDVIVSATFLTAISLVSLMCLQMLKDSDTYLDYLCNWELIVWCLCLGVYLLRFMTLGLKINKKYRNLSVLITEQINLYLQMEQKPHKKEELILANNVLKLAEDLLKELESPFKISGFSANPFIYNMTRVVILSAFSTVLTELLGFKLKLYKIKFKT